MKRLRSLAGTAVVAGALGLGASACGLAPYVAKVNGTVLTRSQLFSELSAIASSPSDVSSYAQSGITVNGKVKGTYTTSFVDQIIDQRISLILIQQANQKRKATITPDALALAKQDIIASVGGDKTFDAFPSAYQSYLVNSAAEFTTLEASLAGIPVTQATVQRYYTANPAALSNTCASVIVVATKAKADQIETLLRKGTSFASLAKTYSEDASTASNGGAVGCSIPEAFGQVYGPTVAQVVQTQASGKVSAPVLVAGSAGSAYVIVEVTSRTLLPEDKALPIILGIQLNPVMSKLNAYVANELKTSKVSVDPSYGKFSIKNGAPDVLAPTSPPAADLVVPTSTTATAPSQVPTTSSPTPTTAPPTTTAPATKTVPTTATTTAPTTAPPKTTTTAKPKT
jgi:foldase protein PrsA